VAAAAAAELPVSGRVASLLLWLLVLVPPLYFSPSAKDAFRLPKQMLSEWLAVASLVPLAWSLRRVEAVRWRDLWRQPALRAVLPLLAVASAGLLTSAHPLHVREGLADLWIGGACLVGWSAALPAGRLERLLGALPWPAVALAALGILQFHGLQPLGLAGVRAGSRFAVTSTAGNPGDLGAFLVLPCLIAQWRLARRPRAAAAAEDGPARRAEAWRRGWLVAALAVCVYAMTLTQTFAALTALVLGSLVLWGGALRHRAMGARRLTIAGASLAALVLLAAGGVAAVPALAGRVKEKAAAVRQGDWNTVLTGRLDGWRAALWMLGQHPWAGVGQGAYRAEFVPAKLALLDRGVAFPAGTQQNFVNAHDEPLEVGADCGLPGLLAVAWALWVLGSAARSRAREAAGAGEEDGTAAPRTLRENGTAAPRALRADGTAARRALRAGGTAEPRALQADGAFAAAGLTALGVLCLVDFPFRVALVAFPVLLFLSWVLRPAAAEAAA
jgi:O-antigen ligase